MNKRIKKQNSYVGRTYSVKDNDLPHKNAGSNKLVDIAVIEEKGKNIGAVRTTTKKTKNSMPFVPKHKLYLRHKNFLETEFYNGDVLNVDDLRLKENPWKNNLSRQQVENVRSSLYLHSRQSAENIKKRDALKFGIKKSRH